MLNGKLTEAIPDEEKFRIYISPFTQLNIDVHNRVPTTDARMLRRMLMIALWLYVRKTKMSIWRVLDNIAIATPITACLIRMGNLMNSEIIGKSPIPADGEYKDLISYLQTRYWKK